MWQSYLNGLLVAAGLIDETEALSINAVSGDRKFSISAISLTPVKMEFAG